MKKLIILLLFVPLISFGQTPDEHYDSAVGKFQTGDYSGALYHWNKLIELFPDFPDNYYNRGMTKGKLKDIYGEIRDYTKAIELNPDYASAYYNRGNAKGGNGTLFICTRK